MSTREQAQGRGRELLEVSVPDGLLDDEHAEKLAAKLVDETLRTLGVREQHTARVWFADRDGGPENMQAPDAETACRVAAEQDRRGGVDRVSTDMRWCSRWHRTG
jgi:hypothetical protein